MHLVHCTVTFIHVFLPVRLCILTLVKVSDWNSFRVNQSYSESFRNLFPNHSESFRPRIQNIFRIGSETDSRMARCSSYSLGMNINPILSPENFTVLIILNFFFKKTCLMWEEGKKWFSKYIHFSTPATIRCKNVFLSCRECKTSYNVFRFFICLTAWRSAEVVPILLPSGSFPWHANDHK